MYGRKDYNIVQKVRTKVTTSNANNTTGIGNNASHPIPQGKLEDLVSLMNSHSIHSLQ